MPKKDFPLLWKVYDHIVAHQGEWNQRFWAARDPVEAELSNARVTLDCGTSQCFAGETVRMHPDFEGFLFERKCWHSSFVKLREQPYRHDISDLAQEMLGITSFEANELFYSANSLKTIHHIISKWEYYDTVHHDAEVDKLVEALEYEPQQQDTRE